VLIFFDFWCFLSNAKSITQFCKKHFTQLIKLIDIFKQWDLSSFQNIISQNIDRAHHWHDAHALFWSSRTDEKHYWCDVDEWMKSNYCYLVEEFSQDEKYTEEITQAASTLWAQWM